MMKRIYIVTGAAGHLGSTIVRKLAALGVTVRALLLPGESAAPLAGCPSVELYRGDVRDPATLEPLFAQERGESLVVIHTAALVSIESKVSPQLRAVNVGGVEHIVALCLSRPRTRLIHVGSVHALPEQPGRGVIEESEQFHAAWVKGAYAKTKAEAAQKVLDAVRRQGLDAVVLLPSGILGPGDYGHNNLNRLVRSCVTGRLHTLVRGGYDLVDVRDVADACIAAVDKGRRGECYILSGRHYDWHEVVPVLEANSDAKVSRFLSPAALKPAAPFLELWARLRRRQPLFTGYSLYCMCSNDNFTSRKARAELGFQTRPIEETLAATSAWELARAAQDGHTRAPSPACGKARRGRRALQAAPN